MSYKADEIPTLAAGRGGTCVTEEYRSFCSVFLFYLLCRYLSIYLSVQERDPKAHRFLGQVYEAQDNIEKAFGCYKVSTSLSSRTSCFMPSYGADAVLIRQAYKCEILSQDFMIRALGRERICTKVLLAAPWSALAPCD